MWVFGENTEIPEKEARILSIEMFYYIRQP